MLLFDMDGTLIDSNGIWKDVDTRFLEKRGLPYTQEYYEGVAHTIFPLAAKFTKEFCHLPESEAAIMAEWMEMAGDIYATDVTEKPGVRAYLEQMKRRGERMAVVTSAVPVHCRAALTHLGLLPYFERIFFAQELGTEKKYPVLWEKVAAALGVSPADCTLFDDSVEAIRGAKTAGMHTVGVADPYFASTADEMARTCDRYISSFGELRVSQLLCGVGGKSRELRAKSFCVGTAQKSCAEFLFACATNLRPPVIEFSVTGGDFYEQKRPVFFLQRQGQRRVQTSVWDGVHAASGENPVRRIALGGHPPQRTEPAEAEGKTPRRYGGLRDSDPALRGDAASTGRLLQSLHRRGSGGNPSEADAAGV